MKISTFDRQSVKVIRESLTEALAAVSEKHGITLKTGSITFSASNCTVKVEAATVAADGSVNSREADAFRAYASMHGLTPEHLGRTFTVGGETFKLSGYRAKAPKKPFLAEKDGKTFVLPEWMVLQAFGITKRAGVPSLAGTER